MRLSNPYPLNEWSTPQGDIEYEYASDGRLTTMTDVGVGDTVYSFSSTTGRLTSITNPFSEVTSFTYDSLGRLERETKHSGEHTLLGYDSRGRVISIDHKKSDNSVLAAEDYTYDSAGNLTQKIVDSVTTTFTYDVIDQLLSVSRTGYSASYTYDANGNRASKTLGGTTETYTNDSGDKLTEIKVGTTTIKSFGYDGCGRRTSMTDSSGTTNYAYDYQSRITSITKTGMTTNSFAYNGFDTRVSKTDAGGSFTYKRMGSGVTAPVLSDGAATYTPGVSERRGSTTSYYMTDRLGSPEEGSASQIVLIRLQRARSIIRERNGSNSYPKCASFPERRYSWHRVLCRLLVPIQPAD